MPTATPKMQSQVPCDGKWHTIHTSPNGTAAHVFVKFTGATCKFTARLSDDPPAPAPAPGPPPPPGPAPQNAVPKVQLVIPTGGGYRGLNAMFNYFEVKCEPAAGEAPPQEQQPPPQAQQMPEIEASRELDGGAAALHECPFEWYMML